MTEHQHQWTPKPLAMARYVCACGAEGVRRRDGAITRAEPQARQTWRDPPDEDTEDLSLHGSAGVYRKRALYEDYEERKGTLAAASIGRRVEPRADERDAG